MSSLQTGISLRPPTHDAQAPSGPWALILTEGGWLLALHRMFSVIAPERKTDRHTHTHKAAVTSVTPKSPQLNAPPSCYTNKTEKNRYSSLAFSNKLKYTYCSILYYTILYNRKHMEPREKKYIIKIQNVPKWKVKMYFFVFLGKILARSKQKLKQFYDNCSLIFCEYFSLTHSSPIRVRRDISAAALAWT